MPRQQHAREILLRLLRLHDFVLERVADVEADRGDLARLPDAVDAGEGLLFDGGVPGWDVSGRVCLGRKGDDVGGCGWVMMVVKSGTYQCGSIR